MKILMLGAIPNKRYLASHSCDTSSLYSTSEWAALKDKKSFDIDESPLKRIVPDVTDYDMVVVDMQYIDNIGVGVLYELSHELGERIHSGAILLCFVDNRREVYVPWFGDYEDTLAWLPVTVNPRARTGHKYYINKGTKFEPLLKRYLQGTKWECDFDPPAPESPVPRVQPLAYNKNQLPIALHCKHGLGHIVLLPRSDKRDEFLGRFLREIIPELAPKLIAAPTAEEAPAWLSEWLDRISKVQSLASEISVLEEQQRQLGTKIDEIRSQKQELERWGDLLWQTGEQILEERVREAFRLLGLDAQKKYGVDVVVEDAQGTLYAEVEGTIKGVEVDKSRKLLEDISRADDPTEVRGAIIGNAFRLERPEDRPPGQHKFFCREVEKAADKFGWVLMTTRELFDLVCRHLDGDNTAAQELRNRLFE